MANTVRGPANITGARGPKNLTSAVGNSGRTEAREPSTTLPSASLSTVSAAPASIADDGALSTVTVTVKDSAGAPMPGVVVVLSATGTGNTITQPNPTNASGVTTGTVSSTVAESKTITALANGVPVTQTATVTVTHTFAPTDLAGLAGWWKADGITGLGDADPVAMWIDSSSNGRTETQSTAAQRPTYRTNIQNGKPIVRFDGVDDWLSFAGPVSWTDLTVFCVAARSGAPGFGMMVVPTRAQCELRWDGSGTQPQFIRHTTNATWGSGVSGWHLYQGEWADATDQLAFRLDGGTAVTATDATPTSDSALDLGARGGAVPFAGDMAEVLIYHRVLSTSERQQIETYLREKWGTP